ncbi:MAG: hypothetical protein NEA02_10065 [Thermoanaerobaculia bacterium]|nr:hypothetical protein [Thermoanaerobaculia bacterium]
MLESLKFEDFFERVGEGFRVGEAGVPGLTLIEATDLSRPESPGPRRSPFSLVFRGPMKPVLPQRTYALEHASLGRLEIFIVPIGPDASGMRYEAVFN